MDQSFLLRARRLLDEAEPARVDLDTLTAALSARQSASPTARAQARRGGTECPRGDADGLAELLLAGPDWRGAASARQGCFSRPGSGLPSTPHKRGSP